MSSIHFGLKGRALMTRFRRAFEYRLESGVLNLNADHNYLRP